VKHDLWFRRENINSVSDNKALRNRVRLSEKKEGKQDKRGENEKK
jgi:hypothetical protein